MVLPRYSFDASAFINAFRRYYPPDVFPSFWKAIEDRIVSGATEGFRMLGRWRKTDHSRSAGIIRIAG